MSSKFKFHFAARTELSAAQRYYRRTDAALAKRFASEVLGLLERAANNPKEFPEQGILPVPTRHQTLFLSVRKAVLPRTFPYAIFYYVRDGGVVVIAVAHTSRRPGFWGNRA